MGCAALCHPAFCRFRPFFGRFRQKPAFLCQLFYTTDKPDGCINQNKELLESDKELDEETLDKLIKDYNDIEKWAEDVKEELGISGN